MVNEITENHNQKISFFDRITRQVHMSVNDSLLIDPIFGITASRPLHQASHPCIGREDERVDSHGTAALTTFRHKTFSHNLIWPRHQHAYEFQQRQPHTVTGPRSRLQRRPHPFSPTLTPITGSFASQHNRQRSGRRGAGPRSKKEETLARRDAT